MKRLLFLLFLFPLAAFTCQEHPTSDNSQPLWVQALVKASSGSHEDHKHDDLKSKKELPKKDIKKADQ